MFDDSIITTFTSSFDSWSTDQKTVDTQLEYQVDIGSAQNINSPKCIIVTEARIGVPNKANKVAVFDSLNVRKYHVDINGVRYPRDGVNIDYASKEYRDQYEDLKLFYKEYVGGELLDPFISYSDMKNKYPIQLIDLSSQVDHINPKKDHLFLGVRGSANNARLFMILIRHREIEMLSDGIKIRFSKIFRNDKT